MNHSGVAGYLALKHLDRALCNSIVLFAEELVGKYRLDPNMARDVKQELCQFAVDMAVRQATRIIYPVNEKV